MEVIHLQMDYKDSRDLPICEYCPLLLCQVLFHFYNGLTTDFSFSLVLVGKGRGFYFLSTKISFI
jgi:hypothetical protein